MNKEIIVDEELLLNKIFLIRDQKVMIDEDLAELYGVETRRLNEQVKRNADRFPEDFMIQLTEIEFENLMSQNATSSSNSKWGGRRKLPYAFTEHGILMLSSVLNSQIAMQVNIKIMRVYMKLRKMILSQKDILLKLEELENKVHSQDTTVQKHEGEIEVIFRVLRQLVSPDRNNLH